MHPNDTIPLGLCQCGCGRATRIAPKNDRSKNWVRGVPLLYVRGHSACKVPYSPVDYIEEDRGYSTPCWIWQRCLSGEYGQISVGGKMRQAHVVYYERHVGPIPEGRDLDHLCRVPRCVNPAHVEPVLPAVNTRRGNSTPLTFADVQAIREIIGTDTYRNIGLRFGVSDETIGRIARRETWFDEVA